MSINSGEGVTIHTLLPEVIAHTVNCHDDLLSACKLVDRAFCGDGVQMSTAVDACLLAIAKATQKEGAK